MIVANTIGTGQDTCGGVCFLTILACVCPKFSHFSFISRTCASTANTVLYSIRYIRIGLRRWLRRWVSTLHFMVLRIMRVCMHELARVDMHLRCSKYASAEIFCYCFVFMSGKLQPFDVEPVYLEVVLDDGVIHRNKTCMWMKEFDNQAHNSLVWFDFWIEFLFLVRLYVLWFLAFDLVAGAWWETLGSFYCRIITEFERMCTWRFDFFIDVVSVPAGYCQWTKQDIAKSASSACSCGQSAHPCDCTHHCNHHYCCYCCCCCCCCSYPHATVCRW